MRKNQKLGLVAIAFLAVGFGSWYLTSPNQAKAAPPVSPAAVISQQERAAKQTEMIITDIPEEKKKVERALDQRFGHLGEEVLTAASIDKNGETVFFDRQVIAGLNGKGEPVYAQGFHRAYLFNGPLMREVKNEPVTLSLKGKKPGSGLFAQAVRSGAQIDRDNLPQPKTPAGGE